MHLYVWRLQLECIISIIKCPSEITKKQINKGSIWKKNRGIRISQGILIDCSCVAINSFRVMILPHLHILVTLFLKKMIESEIKKQKIVYLVQFGKHSKDYTLSSKAEDSLIAAMASRSAFSVSVKGSEPFSIHSAIVTFFWLLWDKKLLRSLSSAVALEWEKTKKKKKTLTRYDEVRLCFFLVCYILQ